MRVAVLPRNAASAVASGAIVRMGWAFGGLSLLLDVPILIESYARAGAIADVTLPAVLLALQLVVLVVAALRASAPLVIGYLLVATASVVAFQLIVLMRLGPRAPELLMDRPALALVLIGVETTSILVGLGWTTVGMTVASIEWGVVQLALGHDYRPQYFSIAMYLVAATGYLVFAAAQARQRRRVPDFDALAAETAAHMTGNELSHRTTSVVHDTLLNDLALVMTTSSPLSPRVRDGLTAGLNTLQLAEWVRQPRVSRTRSEDRSTRNEIVRVLDDVRWRGLAVDLSGTLLGSYELAPGVGEALVAATRASLENVLRHAGTNAAEVASSADEHWISISVIDHGAGFDPDAIPPDRLGLRESVVGRIESVGGRVRIFSRPGTGTSIVFAVPVQRVIVTEREASDGA